MKTGHTIGGFTIIIPFIFYSFPFSILTLPAASLKSLILFQNHINKGRVTQRGIERDFLIAEQRELRLLQRKTRVMNVING